MEGRGGGWRGAAPGQGTLDFLPSGFRNRERMNFCCFKLSWWSWVTAALGEEYTCLLYLAATFPGAHFLTLLSLGFCVGEMGQFLHPRACEDSR